MDMFFHLAVFQEEIIGQDVCPKPTSKDLAFAEKLTGSWAGGKRTGNFLSQYDVLKKEEPGWTW